MRRDSLFWGAILIMLGGFFMLQAMGLIANAWGWFWPTLLILIGIWIIVGSYLGPRFSNGEGETFEVDLQQAVEASLDLDHGAGRVKLTSGAPAGKFMVGSSGIAMSHSVNVHGDRLDVKVEAGPSFIPFIGPHSGTWDFRLTPDIPIRMDIDSGASRLDLDLEDLNVPFLNLDTGASSTTLTLPARGGTDVDIDVGAASVDILVPEGVSARIVVDEGVTALDIDQARFPRQPGNIYESPDFSGSEKRASIKIDVGAGKISIR